jgi:hypothetical protein
MEPQPDPNYWARRRADLQRRALGDFTDDEMFAQMLVGGRDPDTSDQLQLTALRSVSPSARYQIAVQRQYRRARVRFINDAKRELLHLLNL